MVDAGASAPRPPPTPHLQLVEAQREVQDLGELPGQGLLPLQVLGGVVVGLAGQRSQEAAQRRLCGDRGRQAGEEGEEEECLLPPPPALVLMSSGGVSDPGLRPPKHLSHPPSPPLNHGGISEERRVSALRHHRGR